MVTGAAASPGQVAPGDLERVRELLNSWLIPNVTRQPTDEFEQLAGAQGWGREDSALVRELRDDIRRAVESGDAARLSSWVSRLGLRPVISDAGVSYQHDAGPAGDFMTIVLGALTAGQWSRLKACPDCRWVFYDYTRNGSKRWCLMNAGSPDGRACGTIAKVRRYRDRQAAQ